MKRSISILAVVAFMFFLLGSAVMAQPIDYCEGNFDNDLDQDGTDAFVFKQDYGRSSLKNPCPVIECQTAEQLEIRIVQLETQLAQVTALLANVTRGTVNGQDTIRFSNVNVQIVNGSGTTDGTTNGLGNLIVGYNEIREDPFVNDRTGSHNIVVGAHHNYLSYGGLVAGRWNTVSGPYSSVSGGVGNTASVQASSVSGGNSNTANGSWASVSGGYGNSAGGNYASVSGGQGNLAAGRVSSVSGGDGNRASGQYANVSGGRYNEASGDYSFVGGGGYTDGIDGNEAFGHYSAILGGRRNLAGDPALTDYTIGQSSTVSGGSDNAASGFSSSVSGGRHNEASGDYSSVAGGGASSATYGNTAFSHYSAVFGGRENITGDPTLTDHSIGIQSSVSGGRSNAASGQYSSVSGGYNHDATDIYDWAAGSLLENQ